MEGSIGSITRRIDVISPDQFDLEWLRNVPVQKRRRGNQGTKVRKKYKDIVTSFDIETTSIQDEQQSFMYVWQWALGPSLVVMGRTWNEFLEFTGKLHEALNDDEWIVVFVHNLSFEFQFLSGIYPFCEDEVFAVGSRKVLKCDMLGFLEYRCSLLHSGMSLEKWTKRLGVEHGKLSGEDFDYSKIRGPWTELSDYELQYCLNDVLGVVEAIEYECKMDDDNLYTLPLTSTGYVRRDAKHAMENVNHYWMNQIQPTWHVYCMLREAFRGGNTHANRYYAGRILKNVKSCDRSSSYPDALVNCEYPMRPFHEYGPATMEEVIRMITVRHKAVLMRVKIWNLRLKDDGWGCPYISYDKVRHCIRPALDNGRILEAEYLETTITDIDFQIILSEYDFDDMDPYDVCHSTYGKLPKEYTDLIISYYEKKTTLKGVKDQEYYYNRSKERLNSLYGLTAQDPVKISDVYRNGHWTWPEDEDPKDLLYKTTRKSFLPYQWGVWCTSHGRMQLERGIRMAGDNFVYTDTDSIKYIGDIDLHKLNAPILKASKESGAQATDPSGVTHYMGVFEVEGEMSEFATLGAKKYCFVEDGELHITIAGVNKKKGAEELQKAGGISAFRTGFVFHEGGGNEVVYNDLTEPYHVDVDGHDVEITKNVFIVPSEYTLGVTDEYQRMIDNPKILHRIGVDNFVKIV